MTTEPPQPTPDVFLSYASADRERALHIADLLESSGVSVWIDRKSIAGGTSWSAEIVRGIEGCTTLAVLCSPASMASPNVQQEIQLAWDARRPILPLLLESVHPPDAIRYAFAGRQWIEVLAGPDDVWLVPTMRALAGLGVSTAPRSAAPADSGPGPGPSSMPLLPPRRSLTNLPVQATPFIGREQEVVAASTELRRPEVRLLTFTGPGGVGKTRLALATADRIQAEFPDGVVFVPLTAVTDPSRVGPAIAEMLGVRETGERSLVDSLTAFFGPKRCLLVLDNFEQVIEAAGAISQLLRGCTNLKVLVTSRSALRAYGEQIWPVEPLSLPALGQRLPVTELAQYDAVRLFAARARAVRPDFELSAENVAVVIDICRRLDGLPLAIELAAARVRLFSPAALLARLDRRLQLLTGGARDLPARQQTLRGTMSWSYDLLSDEEKKLFRRLAVFVGGWTVEAAAPVSSGGGSLDLDILDGLQSLLEKSLLRTDEVNGAPRLAMLETMREFALEQLKESGEQDEAEQQHAAYFIELLNTAEPFLTSGQRRVWLVRLAREQENVLAILARSAASSDPTVRAAGTRIAGPFALFCTFHENGPESRTWIETALKNRADALPADQGRALAGAGILILRFGDPVAALQYLDEAMPLLRDSGNQDGYAGASGIRCLLLASVKGAEAALAYRPEAEALMRGSKHP